MTFSFGDMLLDEDERLIPVASRFYLQISVLENLLLLHKTLMSILAKNCKFHSLVSECFKTLCDALSDAEGKEKSEEVLLFESIAVYYEL